MRLPLLATLALALAALARAQPSVVPTPPVFLTYQFQGQWSSPYGGSGVSYLCQDASGRVAAVLGGWAVADLQVNYDTMTGYWHSGGADTRYNWGAMQIRIVDFASGSTASGLFWFGEKDLTLGGPYPITISRLSFIQPTSQQCWDQPSSMLGAFGQQLTQATPKDSKTPGVAFCLDTKNGVSMRGSAVDWYPTSDGSSGVGRNWGFFGTSWDSGKSFNGIWKEVIGNSYVATGDAIARGFGSNTVALIWWYGSGAAPTGRFGAQVLFGQSATAPPGDVGFICTRNSASGLVASLALLALSCLAAVLAL